MTVPATPDYGASVNDVRELLPHATISADSVPSEDDVAGYLTRIAGRVAVRLGTPARWWRSVESVELAARDLIALGAAAYAEDARFPERSSSVGTARYGAVLWERFTAALDELATAVLTPPPNTDGAPPPVDPVTGLASRPAARFPPPLFTDAAQW